MGQTLSSCAPCLSGAQTNEDETPYGGSLRSQFRTLKKGSDGHGKSEGSQGSGQNGIHINENIYESPSMSESPGAEDGSPGSVSHGKSGGSQGFGQDGSQTNENDEEKEIEQTWKFKCHFCNHSEPHNSDNALTGSEEFCPYYLRRYLSNNWIY